MAQFRLKYLLLLHKFRINFDNNKIAKNKLDVTTQKTDGPWFEPIEKNNHMAILVF